MREKNLLYIQIDNELIYQIEIFILIYNLVTVREKKK